MKYKVRILNPTIGVPVTAIDKLDDSWEIIDMKDIPKISKKNIYKRLIIRKRSKTQCGATTTSQVQECTA